MHWQNQTFAELATRKVGPDESGIPLGPQTRRQIEDESLFPRGPVGYAVAKGGDRPQLCVLESQEVIY